jgi:hypothetical protein
MERYRLSNCEQVESFQPAELTLNVQPVGDVTPPVVHNQDNGTHFGKPVNQVATLDPEGKGSGVAAQPQPPGRFDLQKDLHRLDLSRSIECVQFKVDAVIVQRALHHPTAAQDVTFDVMDAKIFKDVFSCPALASQLRHHPVLKIAKENMAYVR